MCDLTLDTYSSKCSVACSTDSKRKESISAVPRHPKRHTHTAPYRQFPSATDFATENPSGITPFRAICCLHSISTI